MANIKTRAVTRTELMQITDALKNGFILPDGTRVRSNDRISTALIVMANIGVRVGDLLKLRLCDIIQESGRYRLNIIEEKTKKARTFTVPSDVYIYIQNYVLRRGLRPTDKLFDLTVRAVESYLKMACTYLGITGVSTHSFRKFFATSIYNANGHNIELVRELLQHSSIQTTQRYLSLSPKLIEDALSKHIVLPT